ncbi:MAG TPA: hypothetical protein VFW70_18745 [Methylomirabilota bacterium]|nr:hypothetical protein [Methylomirabilota bacterium]
MDIAYDSMASAGWDTWIDAWIRSCLPIVVIPLAVVIVLIVAVAATEPRIVRRRFWCALHRREADVRFATRGLTPAPRAVLSCSVFEPCHAITCRRRCLDASYRHQWPSPLAARDGGDR